MVGDEEFHFDRRRLIHSQRLHAIEISLHHAAAIDGDRLSGTTSAPGKRVLSRLNGWPVRSPVNASPMSSRATAHDSGSMRFATSSS
jgi:hypothetical protein